jgi:phage gpG-like protein
MTIPRDFYTDNENLRISGLEDYRNFFLKMKEELVDTSSLGDDIAKIIIDGIQKRTAAGVDYKGTPFQPYKSKSREYKNKSPVNLRRSGSLLSSIQQKFLNSDALLTVVLFYTGIEAIVGEVHHIGAISGRKAGRFQMPKRSFFNFSDEDIDTTSDLVEKKIVDFIRHYEPK